MVDLRDVPLIDEHVHIFAPDAARGGLDPLATFERAFLERLSRVADDKRVVALKSIIAYRTGLAVEPVTRADAGSAFSHLKRSPYAQGLLRRVKVPLDLFATVKRLRDYLLWRALE